MQGFSFLTVVDGERLESPELIDSMPLEPEDDFEDDGPVMLYLVQVMDRRESFDDYDRFAGYVPTGSRFEVVNEDELADLSVSCGESEGLRTYRQVCQFPARELRDVAAAFGVKRDA